MTTHTPPTRRTTARPVPHAPGTAEREADHVAEAVTDAGVVRDWSYRTVPVSAERRAIQYQRIPGELQTSVDLSLPEEELTRHHASILRTLAQFDESTPDTALLERTAADIVIELARRRALAAGRTFSDAAVARMRTYFVDNARTSRDSCIVALNKGLRLGTDTPGLPTTNKSIEATMGKVGGAGHTADAREIRFLTRGGGVAHGGARPEQLQESVWDTVIDASGGDPGWSVFTMSLLDGYHSVTLTLDATDPSRPRVYWSDQWTSKGGWKPYTRDTLDHEVTHLIQSWWDGQPVGGKHRPVVRVWRVRATAEGTQP